MLRPLLLIGLLLTASTASAQIIYEPVQYQYDGYYYGGSNPDIFAKAQRDSCAQTLAALHRPVSQTPLRVYSDCLPWANAALYGLTPNDAQNQAYHSIPRYFRKADLFLSAAWADGALIVPARAAGRIEIKPFRQPPSTQPAAPPKPLLILPRDTIERPPVPLHLAGAQ